MLDALDLYKSFGPIRALRGVSVSLAPGEILAVFGPNGAGKSTLARCLSTLARPDSGSVRIGGEKVTPDSGARLRARIGYVGHQTLLYDSMTAEENLTFYAALHGVASPGDRARALLAEFGLSSRAGDAVRGLSRGTQQRLSLARALVHSPDALLLDEPATGLDPTAAAALHDRLLSHKARGGCALVVSHDLAASLPIADRYVVLRGGALAAQGSARGADPREIVGSHFSS